MIKLPQGVQDNLQFLCVEIDAQIANLQLYFERPTPILAKRIRDRAGYAYNLKTTIHSSAISSLLARDNESIQSVALRSIEFIATDLERIAEICRNCVMQCKLITDYRLLMPKSHIGILKIVREAIELVIPAIQQSDSKFAIQISEISRKLQVDHNKLLKKYIHALKKRKDTEQLTHALFVAYEMKQMGDVLLHISESIISANLGQPVNFERYMSLQLLMSNLEESDEFTISTIAETRSGSAISGITSANGYQAIYKDGQKRKLKDEKEGVNSWHDIYPGLAPKILSYKKQGKSAALLIEHLPGYTIENVILNGNDEVLELAQKALNKTLRSVWRHTKIEKVISAKFMLQLLKRLPDVYKIHPEFEQKGMTICGQKVNKFDNLIKQAAELEKRWSAPFSVYIHGDFNLDNIIFDPIDKRINFIDLHRSQYMDYVQDVSIFMVSNYRLQILDAPRRQRLMNSAMNMYAVARRFAVQQNDKTFEVRLALGLIRAFVTSTRFILDKSLASRMFLRARYLIELVVLLEPAKTAQFRLPIKEIFVE